MTTDDAQNPRKVGYRNPPRAGQFQKGTSGNPRGRPKKRRDKSALPTHRDPTAQEVIRAEINRNISITDHQGRHTIKAKQAVVRAMFTTAAKGGVLAQRSFLELAAKEEERHQKEKEESFEFWRNYKEETEERIAAGAPRPDNQPDPDDIKLDWRTQEVRIDGPIDREDRAAAEIVRAVAYVAYEMAFYRDELSYMCDEEGRVVRAGPYWVLHLLCTRLLWPRMRTSAEARDNALMGGALLGWDVWGEELKARCKALGVPFLPRKKGSVVVTIPLAKLGIKMPIVVPPTPPAPRRRRRRDAVNPDASR